MAEEGHFLDSLMEDFFVECDEHLATFRRVLLELEEGGAESHPGAERMRTIARVLHTLKGLSGMVGFPETESLAHSLEDWLRAAGPRGLLGRDVSLDPLFQGVQRMEEALARRRNARTPLDTGEFTEEVARAIRALSATPDTPAPAPAHPAVPAAEAARVDEAIRRGDAVFRFEFIPTVERVQRGVGVEAVRGRIGALGELISAAPRIVPTGGVAFQFVAALPSGVAPPEEWGEDGITWTPYEAARVPPPDAPEPPTPVAPASVVRVELSRLDELIRMIGDLVISRGRLADVLRDGPATAKAQDLLLEINTAMERQLRELRDGVMRVRLVPVGEVFERMRFVVRDVAQQAGKQVQVELQGQSTELDKLLVERIMEPLLHLVRNAISHGIETPAERAAGGKRPEGRLSLRAHAAGERVVIEVEDDGRGVDREVVAERARAHGIIGPGAALDEGSLLDVLSAPGFSTRDEADRASGRGVGMAVVRSTIRTLGGEITMRSERGRGTRFTIELPLTLMIVDALLVGIGDQVMAVPQPALHEVLQIEPGQITAFERNEVIQYRGGVLPLARLARLFRIERPAEPPSPYVLVVGSRTEPIGLVVDRLAGLREIVVRPIADPLVMVPGVSGAAELGDGRVCLILDAAALGQLARERAAPSGPVVNAHG